MSRQAEANSGSSSEYSDYESSCSDEDEQEYEVERILNHRGKGSYLEYEVKWVGYEETTWEPAENLENSAELVKEYWLIHNDRQQALQKMKGRKMEV